MIRLVRDIARSNMEWGEKAFLIGLLVVSWSAVGFLVFTVWRIFST